MSANNHGFPSAGTLGDALHADFFKALWEGDVAYLTARLDAGVSPDVVVDLAGPPALIEAVKCDKIDIANLLVDRGADVNQTGPTQKVALHHVIDFRSDVWLEFARRLAECGAVLDAPDHSGKTPLHFAAEHGALEMCELLLRLGASIDAVANNRMTALHYAAWHGQCEAIRVLVGHGVGVNDFCISESTPLHLAASSGQVQACRVLCELGASGSFSRNGVLDQYLTPFQVAIHAGNEEVVRFFMLECGEKLTQRTADGRTMATVAKLHAGLYRRLRSVHRALGTADAVDMSLSEVSALDTPQRGSRPLSPL